MSQQGSGQAANGKNKYLNALNLHIAGVVILLGVVIFLGVKALVAFHEAGAAQSDSFAQQQILYAQLQARLAHLQGLPEKVDQARDDAALFYEKRLAPNYSSMAAELGEIEVKNQVRLTRAQYLPSPAIDGVQEVRIDANLSGDYAPLMHFINDLERDKNHVFFIINAITLTGQQGGMVNLRLRMSAYLREGANDLPSGSGDAAADTVSNFVSSAPDVGPSQPGLMQGALMALKVGTEDKKKVILAAALGVIVVGLLGYEIYDNFLSSGTPAPTVAAAPASSTHIVVSVPASSRTAVRGHDAAKVGVALTRLDPTLHPELMEQAESLEYSGKGRNIFSLSAAIPVIEAVKGPVRPIATGPAVPAGPPPPPPIDLKFFGFEAARSGARKAFLLHGEDIFIASEGDVVDHRYKVVKISPFSLQVEDIPYHNTQTLSLVQN